MLDITHKYANKWRYTFNTDKSVVMVLGETPRLRAALRMAGRWKLGEHLIAEVDEQHHLGILRSVYNTSVYRTNERCSSARSAFYALNSIGSRFSSLHPITSYRLYQCLCLPMLLYGSKILTPTKTELLMLERVHRKILRSIQGLPVHCKSSLLSSLLGSLSVEDIIMHRKLSFAISLVSLDDTCLAKQVLRARCSTNDKLLVSYNNNLDMLNLPDLDSLLSRPFSPSSWKRSTKKQLLINSLLHLPEDNEAYPVVDCDFKLGRPLRQWLVGLGDSRLTRLNLFRIKLLVCCAGLEQDATKFRVRDRGISSVGDQACKLCGHKVEDAHHFITVCPSLSVERTRLLASAPDAIGSKLPDPTLEPSKFTSTVLDINWIEHLPTQSVCIQFLDQLRNSRSSVLYPL